MRYHGELNQPSPAVIVIVALPCQGGSAVQSHLHRVAILVGCGTTAYGMLQLG